jgi:hypothetical protein
MSSDGCWSRRGMGVERGALVLIGALIAGSGCSGGDAAALPADMSGVMTGTAAEGGAGAAGRGGAAGNTASPDRSSQDAAAASTAETAAGCSAIAPFYWEIGDSGGTLASGSVGSGAPGASTVMAIASASKWLFGAYAIQKLGEAPEAMNAPFFNLTSGYVGPESCSASGNIDSCLGGGTGVQAAAQVGRFFYGGGHLQKLASLLGIGADDNAALATEVKSQIGPELELEYTEPDPAGGVRMSAGQYGLFLRKLLVGSPTPLLLGSMLGADAVCTNPRTCPTASASPIVGTANSPESWHYSLAHWVEDDAAVGDGAFSSPGAYGFYPWVDAERSLYGVLAREVPATGGIGYGSAVCGRAIRKAWMTGVAQ